jgi:hypothetical protein
MPEQRVQDEQGNIHVFPNEATPEMISQAMGLQTRPDFAKNPPGVPRPKLDMKMDPGGIQPGGMPGVSEGAGLAGGLSEYDKSVAEGVGGGVKDIAKGNVARGAHEVIGGVGSALTPILPFVGAAAPGATLKAFGGGALGGAVGQAGAEALGATPDQAALAGDIGNIAGGYGTIKGSQMIGDLARGEPNAAITKALHVGAKSPKMQATIADVEGARPYLEGGKPTQADIQQRLPQAKAQVWEPYQKAVDTLKDKPVQGPDGPTTVGQLEQERLKISAERQAAKKIRPTDQQSAIQAQKTQAELNARYKAVTNVLDPELKSTGIDPEAIRRTHGNLKGVERNVSGKSTITEPLRPYGVGKMVPQKVPGLGLKWQPIEGARDIVAGRPLWSGKPTDVAMGELFRKK